MTHPVSVLSQSDSQSQNAKTPDANTSSTSPRKYNGTNWVHCVILFGFPLYAILGFIFVPLRFQTIILSIAMYFLTGFGITAGYHRLFAHRAYEACTFVRVLLMFFGSGAFEGSIKWWARNHRSHHRYTDTAKDPYNATRGFWYSHMGWMIEKQDPKQIGFSDITDLNDSKLVRFQHKYYVFVASFAGLVLPAAIASLWGDALGGFLFAGFARNVFVHQSTFFVNSLAHWYGDKTYSDENSAFDSWITAILTLGEGYHNLHHNLANDYRNALHWYQYDPTKWLIKAMSYIGLTWNLRTYPAKQIERARLEMKKKEIEKRINANPIAPSDDQLPQISFEKFQIQSKTQKLVVIGNYVHDITKNGWMNLHPGGEQMMLGYVGKDASSAFGGAVYKHSKLANNLLSSLRVARLADSEAKKGQ